MSADEGKGRVGLQLSINAQVYNDLCMNMCMSHIVLTKDICGHGAPVCKNCKKCNPKWWASERTTTISSDSIHVRSSAC